MQIPYKPYRREIEMLEGLIDFLSQGSAVLREGSEEDPALRRIWAHTVREIDDFVTHSSGNYSLVEYSESL